ncbi:MAG: flippase-like domain-containing protein [Ruminococcus sp.]|nr:flippase-like domain-containing protein [Ruminococcus sp.]
MGYIYLVLSALVICSAHFVRTIRWELFIEIYEQPKRRNLVQALSIGYLINFFIPFKLGDVFRIFYSGRKMNSGKSLGFSTVIMDRFLDVICVGMFFVLLWITQTDSMYAFQDKALFYIILSLIFIVLGLLFYIFRKYIKKFIKFFASIFNSRIQISMLYAGWALIQNFKDIAKRISKIKLIVSTLVMWCLYIISYFLFACSLSSFGFNMSWVDVFITLFSESGLYSSTANIMDMALSNKFMIDVVATIIYTVLPILLLLSISPLLKSKNSANRDGYLNLLPQNDSGERLAFLKNYFSSNNSEYVSKYLEINQRISIIRDFSAGSNATTMLCMDEKSTFFRKYAFGADGEKLYQQVIWLKDNSDILPLPDILREGKTDLYCFYDMPYNSRSVGLFEYVHSMPLEKSWNIIKKSFDCLENTIYQINKRSADADTIKKYIQSKVTANLNKIKKAKIISSLQQYDTIFINGVEYKNLSYYERFLSEDYLQKIFINDSYAVIHGDLTIENIISTYSADGDDDDFYIIDPNTGNVHDSPNLDYGKLLQSIHGGYEFLMSTKDVNVNENRINFLFTRSSAYIELHKLLKDYMYNNFDLLRTKSIYFHEIIHWLRLMPYKIAKDSKRCLLFYAGMLIVMNDVIDMFGEEE